MGPVTPPPRQVYVGHLHTRDLEVTSGSAQSGLWAPLPCCRTGWNCWRFSSCCPVPECPRRGLSGHFGALVSSGMAVCVVQPGTEAPPGGAQGHTARVRSRRGSDLSVSDISGLLAGARPRRPAPALRSRDREPGAEGGLGPSVSRRSALQSVQQNGSIYIHVYFTKSGFHPDPRQKALYRRLATVHMSRSKRPHHAAGPPGQAGTPAGGWGGAAAGVGRPAPTGS